MFKCLSLNQHTIRYLISFFRLISTATSKQFTMIFLSCFYFFLINLNVNSERKENLSSVADINALSIER